MAKVPIATEEMERAILGMLLKIAPSVGKTEEAMRSEVEKAFAASLQQEHQVLPIYEALLNQDQIDQAPHWALEFVSKNAAGEEERHVFPAPKRLEDAEDLQDVLIWCACFGALVAPVVRAALMLHGHKFTWKNIKKRKKATSNLIVIPGGRKDEE